MTSEPVDVSGYRRVRIIISNGYFADIPVVTDNRIPPNHILFLPRLMQGLDETQEAFEERLFRNGVLLKLPPDP